MDSAVDRRQSAQLRRQAAATFVIVVLVGMVAHLYRAAPAVVAPDILAELGLDPAWVAYVTGAFFVTAAAFQAPAGMLFDRLGLKRTIPALMLLGAAGSLVFATAQSGMMLVAGRALMGLGFGVIITGGVVLCARWFEPARFPVVVGLVLAISQIGNLSSTAPTAYLSALLGWRGAFLCLGGVAVVLAIAYFALVRETPPGKPDHVGKHESLRDTINGSWRILTNRQLWPVFAMAFVGYASGFSIAGVWGGVYLHEIHGLGLVARGNVLFAMLACFALGLYFFGWLGRRIGSMKRSVTIGAALTVLIFLVLALLEAPSLPVIVVLLALLGAAAGFCGTIIPHGRIFYPPDSLGRGVTVLNTVVLTGAMAFQIYTGVLMDFMEGLGLALEPSFRILFATHALCLVGGLLAYRKACDRMEPVMPAAGVS